MAGNRGDGGRTRRRGERTRCSTARATVCIRPYSTFKLLVAGAALRSAPAAAGKTVRVRAPAGRRVGNFVKGWTRPVRDDPMDTTPHGKVDLGHGLMVSCNAYFAQLAMRLGHSPSSTPPRSSRSTRARPATAAALKRNLPHAGYAARPTCWCRR